MRACRYTTIFNVKCIVTIFRHATRTKSQLICLQLNSNLGHEHGLTFYKNDARNTKEVRESVIDELTILNVNALQTICKLRILLKVTNDSQSKLKRSNRLKFQPSKVHTLISSHFGSVILVYLLFLLPVTSNVSSLIVKRSFSC